MNPALARLREWAEEQSAAANRKAHEMGSTSSDSLGMVYLYREEAYNNVIKQIDALSPPRPLRADEVKDGWHWIKIPGKEITVCRIFFDRYRRIDCDNTVHGFEPRDYPTAEFYPLTPPQQGEGQP